jgi:hypothetical protein
MKDKIVRFPSATANRGIARITAYRPTSRAETLIAAWLCGWALLTAAECIRQISKASVSIAQPSQQPNTPTYVALTRPIPSNAASGTACPRETCNFSHTTGVLWLN